LPNRKNDLPLGVMSMSLAKGIKSQHYRAGQYDASDTLYARRLADYYQDAQQQSPELCAKFDSFTKDLMKEPQINRFCLLYAIEDFEREANMCLPSAFKDTAFNYMPYLF